MLKRGATFKDGTLYFPLGPGLMAARPRLEEHPDKLVRPREMLHFHASCIVGAPGETWEDIEATERLIRALGLGRANVGFATLFPGTRLDDKARHDGPIRDEDEYLSRLGRCTPTSSYTNLSAMPDGRLMEARDHLLEVIASQG